ncbi:hypothetical protein BU23DRAFT_566796 [Bimuria novae-zelandiae CBS 107.79]|uniref:FAS1 domain-containing protein n=1 Tax=Bimuria novae-zelandiae CBS 107.79 TaxID=1447943 RepID=A0A6A5VJP0_9PLEO|nr:hypothetical protein BU23DRAFT_566796 [Bimuria novae-zelandiae CBS 107.79]
MKAATLFVFVGQLALAMASDATRYSVLSVLYTAMPSSVRSALVAKATVLTFDDAHAPAWYTPLATDVKSLLPQLYPANTANRTLNSATTTVCKTETSTLTHTVTVTAQPSSSAAPPAVSTPPVVVPVPSSSAVVVPAPSSSSAPVPTPSAPESKLVAPYPTFNATASASATGTAPQSSGPGVSPTESAPLTAPTNGVGKTAINGAVIALGVMGSAFLNF